MKFASLSGSLTRLHDGTSYLVAGENVTIASGSNGQVRISSTGGGPGGASTTWIDGNNRLKTTASVSVSSDDVYADAAGSDVYFYVSGTQGVTGSAAKKAVFGGDVKVSGTLSVGTSSITLSENEGIVQRSPTFTSTIVNASMQSSGVVYNTEGSLLYSTTLEDYQMLNIRATVIGANNNGCRQVELTRNYMRTSGSNSVVAGPMAKGTVFAASRDTYNDPVFRWSEQIIHSSSGYLTNINLYVTGTGYVDWSTNMTLNRQQTAVTTISQSYALDPPLEYSSYMLAWYRSDFVNVSGTVVNQWLDISGNGRHLGQGNASFKPTYTAQNASIANTPSIDFNGSTQFMTGTVWNQGGGSGGNYYIFIAWITPSTWGNNGILELSPTTSVNTYAHFMRESTLRIRHGANAIITWSDPSTSTPLYHSWALATGSTNTSQVWQNGVQVGSTSTDNPTTRPNNMRIGSLFDNVYYVAAKYAEIIIYSGTLPQSARTAIETYMASRYNIV